MGLAAGRAAMDKLAVCNCRGLVLELGLSQVNEWHANYDRHESAGRSGASQGALNRMRDRELSNAGAQALTILHSPDHKKPLCCKNGWPKRLSDGCAPRDVKFIIGQQSAPDLRKKQ